MKRQFLILFCMGSLLLAACQSPVPRPQSDDHRPLRVQTGRVTLSERGERREAVGTVRALSTATLSARIVAPVLEVDFQEGSQVARHQLLLKLDSSELESAVAKARAGLQEVAMSRREVKSSIAAAQEAQNEARAEADLASATFARFQQLLKRDSVSRQEFDRVQARHLAAQAGLRKSAAMIRSLQARQSRLQARQSQAKADLRSARIRLSFAEVRAPFAGRVISKSVEVGDLAAPGSPLLVLESLGNHRLEIAVETSLLQTLRKGQRLPIRLDALKLELEGVVEEISPKAEPDSRSALVKIGLPPSPGLRTGMFGRALLELQRRPVLTFPAAALVRRGQLTGVFLISKGRARFRLVRLGKTYKDRLEALAGLEEGQTLLLNPPAGLLDGTSVRTG